MSTDHIRFDTAAIVHDWMIWQDDRGSWWAYNNKQMMHAADRDEMLLHIAQAVGRAPDLDDLRGRLERSSARARAMHAQDELLKRRLNGEGQEAPG